MSHAASESSTCYNCGADLHGPYCASCGQEARARNPTLGEFLHDFTHELTHVDGKTLATVRQLFLAPGFLTREQFEGRRARWVAPLRLYLIVSVMYFALAALGPSSGMFKVTTEGKAPASEAETEREIQRLGYKNEGELRAAMSHTQSTWMPRAMFVLVPFYAWLVKIVVRRRDINFPQYLYFALHVHAAWFGGLALVALARWASPPLVAKGVDAVVTVYGIAYAVLALKRVFDLRTGQAILRSAAVLLLYWIVVTATILAIVLPAVFGRAMFGRT